MNKAKRLYNGRMEVRWGINLGIICMMDDSGRLG